jgi:hypothetical protein
MTTVRRSLFLVFVALLLLMVAAGAALAAKPTRVLIITFDQMQPGYAQQFGMTNILDLQEKGVHFNKAYVGQMASETVVSHATIVSGLFPKNAGYADEVTRLQQDILKADGTVLYPAGSIVTTGDLGIDQFRQLAEQLGYPKLGDYMHQAFPGSVVGNFGQKGYQVFTTAASSSDYYARFGSATNVSTLSDPSVLPWSIKVVDPVTGAVSWIGKYRGPSGAFNWPGSTLTNDRFKVSAGNASDTYGTDVTPPAYLYPEDGRYAPGPWDDHLSGDAWVADAGMRFMAEMPNWSAIHLNFSGIDKIGHMWGGGAVDKVAWDPTNLLTEVHMAFQAKNADDQLGYIRAELKRLGQLDETLIVLLADHGSTYAQNAYYVDAAGGGNLSWYFDPNNKCVNTKYGRYGVDLNGVPVAPGTITNNAALAPLDVDHNLAYSYQSTAIEAWLIDQSWDKKVAEAEVMKTMPGVIATYIRDGDHYVLASKNKMTSAESSWWTERGQELVDTMAFAGGPDVVGLLKDRTGYGIYGDHGGAQQDVQRIPMVMWAQGIKPAVKGTKFRLVDVLPTVLRNMGIPEMAPMDGTAYNLNIK